MSSPERLQQPAVLTSWKEVASFFGKGVRTVQRWEKEDGLPVRRIMGTSKIIVQRDDLTRWLEAQTANRDSKLPREIEPSELKACISAARQLREKNLELRHSVRHAVNQLMNECTKLTDACAGRSDASREPRVSTLKH